MFKEQQLKLSLLNKDFFIYDKEDINLSPNSSSLKIFHDKHTNRYLIDGKEYCVLSICSSWHEILQAINQFQYVLFHDKQQIIGYTTIALAIEKILLEYHKTNSFLETILKTIDESCTVINEKSEIMYWTKGAEELFSLKAEDVIGHPITNFFEEQHLEILHSLNQGKSIKHEQHTPRKDLTVLINTNPVLLNGEIIGAVVSEYDITNQILLNNELYKTSEKLFSLQEEVRRSKNSKDPFAYIKGNSNELKQTLKRIKKAATTDASILINGESGVGKELFAKSIHTIREKENAPFIAINCGAISTGLFESEIFGYEKGAFSGADQKGKKGKVELARGGTLFLDEIGEMPLDMQVKMLRLLQEKRYFPVGGTKEIMADFHLVAATNKDLKKLVNEGKFREDLYYRLNVVNIIIPPLRERVGDIIELTHYFLYEISIKYKRQIQGISQDILQCLIQYPWPGNIRELKNVIERLVVFSENGILKMEDLPSELQINNSTQIDSNDNTTSKSFKDLPLSQQLQEYEKEILIDALKKSGGNKILCAKNLQITRATLYNRLNKLGIN